MVHDFKNFPELTNRQMEIYYFESPHQQISENFTASVFKVIDGDTIRVKTDFRNFDFPVRLLGVAAPERKERGGEASRKWLKNKILNAEVEIIIDKKNRVGKWGRLLGTILKGGMDINQEIIMAGHAIQWRDRKATVTFDFDTELEEGVKWLFQ